MEEEKKFLSYNSLLSLESANRKYIGVTDIKFGHPVPYAGVALVLICVNQDGPSDVSAAILIFLMYQRVSIE